MIEAASDYPLLDVFWTTMIFFAWVIWIWMLFTVFADLFSRHDIGGWGKVGWSVFVIVLPFLGVFAYLIGQSSAMADRKAAQLQASQASFDSYVKSVAATSEPQSTEEIARAKQLLDSGAISEAEYQTLKSKALAS